VRHDAVRRRSGQLSVLDRDCKAHELDNLYVVDTSFFVSANAVNPTLTTVANAMRVGDHLIDRLGAPRRPSRRPPPTSARRPRTRRANP
jgi:choline dehydrogenase-like flavoprotein